LRSFGIQIDSNPIGYSKMKDSGNFNILMYFHDTYGLGHIRRTMAIAEQLCEYDTNILILTGSPIAGCLNFSKHEPF